MNLLHVFDHGDGVLIATFLLLVGMSVASWYVIFWKLLVTRQTRRELQQFEHHNTARGNLAELVGGPNSTSSEKNELELSHTLDRIRTSLERGLILLASIGSSAPFIGLFGTVWGIYNALTAIAAKGNASLNVVAGPMGEALVMTALGLFAAIPAVLAYNAFGRTNRLLMQQYRHIAERILATRKL